jgi:hypothetical protein
VIVNQAPTTTALTVSSSSVNPGQSVTISATVSSSVGSPTGTVIFYDNGSLLNSAALNAGVATYSVSTLTPDIDHTITAYYSGDQNFLTSTSSVTTTVTVGSLDFTINIIGATSKTVMPGSNVTFQVQVSPMNGSFAGPVTISLSGLPPSPAPAIVSPQTIAANSGPQTVTVTIPKVAATAENHVYQLPYSGRRVGPLALALLLILGVGGIRTQRRILSRIVCVLVLLVGPVAVTSLSGCVSSATFTPGAWTYYTVYVTGTSGNLQHTTSYTINLE